MFKISEIELVKSIRADCPICKNSLGLTINPEIITNATNFPVAVSMFHCNFTIVVYIDAKFKARGVEAIMKLNHNDIDSSKKKDTYPGI